MGESLFIKENLQIDPFVSKILNQNCLNKLMSTLQEISHA